jgi:hypothetical protein
MRATKVVNGRVINMFLLSSWTGYILIRWRECRIQGCNRGVCRDVNIYVGVLIQILLEAKN